MKSQKKSEKSVFLWGALFALMPFLWVGDVSAMVQRADVPKLDRAVSVDKSVFEARTKLIDDTPLGDASLAFQVRLPQSWKALPSDDQEGVQVSRDLFRLAAQYVSPPHLDTRSQFRVRVLELKGMVSAENWFMGYALASGTMIEGMATISDRRIEAQYTILDKGIAYAVRGVAEISGSRLVMAEYLVPFEYLEQERDDQVWAMTVFKMKAPNMGPMEPVETFAFVDIAKFSYPKGWVFHAPHITTIDRMEAFVINLKGDEVKKGKDIDPESLQMDGRIDVSLVSRLLNTTPAQEVGFLKEHLDSKGLVIGDMIESVKVDRLNKAIISANIDAYKISSRDHNLVGYEFWVAILESKGRYYIVRLLSIGRNENFPVWAHNIEAFKYVLRTLSPANDSN